MRDTRFIFVEGIMGAGKSTTGEFITDQLQRSGISAQFMFEGGVSGSGVAKPNVSIKH
jgi:thymidylate kinase